MEPRPGLWLSEALIRNWLSLMWRYLSRTRQNAILAKRLFAETPMRWLAAHCLPHPAVSERVSWQPPWTRTLGTHISSDRREGSHLLRQPFSSRAVNDIFVKLRQSLDAPPTCQWYLYCFNGIAGRI